MNQSGFRVNYWQTKTNQTESRENHAMNLEPKIERLSGKKLIGLQMTMSLTQNKTPELWRQFMSRRKGIQNSVDEKFYSMQIYSDSYFTNFDPASEFEKWAAIEVLDFETVPPGMGTFDLQEGLYAVFLYRGASSAGAQTFQYIFQKWLPASEFDLDDRPHFEVLGSKYKNDHPDSEEEIWIPIKPKRSGDTAKIAT